MDVQPSTKSNQLQEGVQGAKQPPTGLCPCFTLGSLPLSPQLQDLWLDDTYKNVVCLHCSNCTKCG